MTNYKTYTWQELKDFINSQKDDRMVNSKDATTEDIGDVLTHFGRKKLKKVVNEVGITTISYGKTNSLMYPIVNDAWHISQFVVQLIKRNPTTYKDVKAVLAKFGS